MGEQYGLESFGKGFGHWCKDWGFGGFEDLALDCSGGKTYHVQLIKEELCESSARRTTSNEIIPEYSDEDHGHGRNFNTRFFRKCQAPPQKRLLIDKLFRIEIRNETQTSVSFLEVGMVRIGHSSSPTLLIVPFLFFTAFLNYRL